MISKVKVELWNLPSKPTCMRSPQSPEKYYKNVTSAVPPLGKLTLLNSKSTKYHIYFYGMVTFKPFVDSTTAATCFPTCRAPLPNSLSIQEDTIWTVEAVVLLSLMWPHVWYHVHAELDRLLTDTRSGDSQSRILPFFSLSAPLFSLTPDCSSDKWRWWMSRALCNYCPGYHCHRW